MIFTGILIIFYADHSICKGITDQFFIHKIARINGDNLCKKKYKKAHNGIHFAVLPNSYPSRNTLNLSRAGSPLKKNSQLLFYASFFENKKLLYRLKFNT